MYDDEAKDVRELFLETSRNLKRSLRLMEEKIPSSYFSSYPAAAVMSSSGIIEKSIHDEKEFSRRRRREGEASTKKSAAMSYGYSSSPTPSPLPSHSDHVAALFQSPAFPMEHFARTAAALQEVASFVNYLDVAIELLPRLEREATHPSAAIQKQRERKGVRWAFTKRLLPLMEPPCSSSFASSFSGENHAKGSDGTGGVMLGKEDGWNGTTLFTTTTSSSSSSSALELEHLRPMKWLWGSSRPTRTTATQRLHGSSRPPSSSHIQEEPTGWNTTRKRELPAPHKDHNHQHKEKDEDEDEEEDDEDGGAAVRSLLLTAGACVDAKHAAPRAAQVVNQLFSPRGGVSCGVEEERRFGLTGNRVASHVGEGKGVMTTGKVSLLLPSCTVVDQTWWLDMISSSSSSSPRAFLEELLSAMGERRWAALFLEGPSIVEARRDFEDGRYRDARSVLTWMAEVNESLRVGVLLFPATCTSLLLPPTRGTSVFTSGSLHGGVGHHHHSDTSSPPDVEEEANDDDDGEEEEEANTRPRLHDPHRWVHQVLRRLFTQHVLPSIAWQGRVLLPLFMQAEESVFEKTAAVFLRHVQVVVHSLFSPLWEGAYQDPISPSSSRFSNGAEEVRRPRSEATTTTSPPPPAPRLRRPHHGDGRGGGTSSRPHLKRTSRNDLPLPLLVTMVRALMNATLEGLEVATLIEGGNREGGGGHGVSWHRPDTRREKEVPSSLPSTLFLPVIDAQGGAPSGLSAAVYQYLVHPCCTAWHGTLQALAGTSRSTSSSPDGGRALGTPPLFSPLQGRRGGTVWRTTIDLLEMTLRTGMYRWWRILETVSKAELCRGGVAEHRADASRQRHRRHLLERSDGKITISVLHTVAEEQELVMEAHPTMRAPSGHQVYLLHRGVMEERHEKKTKEGGEKNGGGGLSRFRAGRRPGKGGGLAVYLYVESGSVYYKVVGAGGGRRETSFELAKSVAEIFKPFS